VIDEDGDEGVVGLDEDGDLRVVYDDETWGAFYVTEDQVGTDWTDADGDVLFVLTDESETTDEDGEVTITTTSTGAARRKHGKGGKHSKDAEGNGLNPDQDPNTGQFVAGRSNSVRDDRTGRFVA
jgi:hypothetical protein